MPSANAWDYDGNATPFNCQWEHALPMHGTMMGMTHPLMHHAVLQCHTHCQWEHYHATPFVNHATPLPMWEHYLATPFSNALSMRPCHTLCQGEVALSLPFPKDATPFPKEHHATPFSQGALPCHTLFPRSATMPPRSTTIPHPFPIMEHYHATPFSHNGASSMESNGVIPQNVPRP